ncbi:RagB/SusD family nutrient uptake outer membrane protein [Flavitalea sp. BT771]|uniref:RagB/SusD family nutrient uptake outer membrane protein n=1 Tax=Flavitalea sp. BT771 TaxID=3063329 RepID=UPI0026E3FB72|nr:RagB/SusD family nutrient uptake outer membrane protein [Flavitalea sp. BT771]MDO6432825.1 RagB/SusD family nutrient uptake outer membrane protein [Flavitalea sp. BT771]MDV6221899.1 RagB/SusD family nutrient uptake outer membrane protein [Flavitalea sp. BT771]
MRSKIIYMMAGLMLMATGCDKKLNRLNPNAQTTDVFWKTREQAYAGCTAIYNALTVDGTYMRSFPGLTDSRGDDFTGDSPWLDLVLTGEFIIPTTSAPVFWIWRDFYLVVNRANQVIKYVGAYDESVLSKTEKNRILGQAYFLRGLAFYNLATTFKVIPIMTEPFTNPSEFFTATASEDDIWSQIYSDLQAAEANLPISYDNVDGLDKGEKGRATKGAAAGLLGKAYLYRKDYAKAGTQFEKFFAGGPLNNVYSLMPDYRDNFKDVNENNSESLFEVQFTEGKGTDINWCCDPTSSWKQVQAISVTYGMEGAGFSDYLPTRWIYDEYKLEKTVDGKDDPRLLVTIASYEPADNSVLAYGRAWWNPQTSIYPRKYTNDGVGNGKTVEVAAESGINYRVLRYADILLMYAEVLNETNKTDQAYSYIQQVRARANLPDLATAKPNMTQAQMRDQLAHERALEFAIEGQRINDLIRWGWFYDPVKLAELKAHDPDFNTWTPGNEYLPIPQQELDANKNLKPNPAN